MKKLYSILFVAIVLAATSYPVAALSTLAKVIQPSNTRGLAGVTYTSRTERGADETRRYSSRKEYQKILQQFEDSADDEPTVAQQQRKTANEYVLDFFAKEFSIARVTKKEGSNKLFWPLQYAKQKTKLLVHHTATSGKLPKTIEEEKQFMQDLYKFHAFSRGRGDIGYNFIVMPSGRIYEGRKGGAGVVGAHATWNNTPSVGVSLVGNFEDNKPQQAQIDATVNLLTALSNKFNIDPLKEGYYFKSSAKYPYVAVERHYDIAGHKDAGSTACPGKYLYALLQPIREAVSNNVANNGHTVVSVERADTILSTGAVVQNTQDLNTLRNTYITRRGFTGSSASIKRLTTAPLASNIANIEQSLVLVLLYDASTTRDTRTLQCSSTCSVRIGSATYKAPSLTVKKSKTGFSFALGKKTYSTTSFAVLAGDNGTVAITDYPRLASNKTPLNIFRQTLLFTTAPLQTISGSVSTSQQIINILKFENYMRGIAEASDDEAQTKTNVLALLSKGYAMYYLGGTYKQPSIPKDALYNAIDDPRMFQKYLGYGRESVSKNRPKALNSTKDMYITYNGLLPILPYFHCSAGFTRSATERRGRSDTPYLQSVVDVGGMCDSGNFEGHGVGLSGKGAAKMAQNGKTGKEIIQYYYPGVELIMK